MLTDKELRGQEAIIKSIHPLSDETAVSEKIVPEPSYLGNLLCGRRSVREFDTASIPQDKIERVMLDCAGGVVTVPTEMPDGRKYDFLHRTIPQGGGICSVSTLLILLRPSGNYSKGIYKFCPHNNRLHTLNKKINTKEIATGLYSDTSLLDRAAAILIISADFDAKAYKYDKLGYRLSLIEVGCALQNALLSIHDVGLAGYAHGGVDGEILSPLLDLKFPMEAPYVAVIMGMPQHDKT